MPSNASAAPHVDLERFRSDLREAGVEEMVVSLLQTFLEDCPGRFAALEHAVEGGNAKTIASAAHAFRSGSGTIRATFLSGQLASLEADAHAGRLQTISAALAEIRIEHVSVMRELESVVNPGNDASRTGALRRTES